MRRLYLQIYLSVVAVALVAVAGAFVWTRYSLRFTMENLPAELEHVAALIAADLPGPETARSELDAYLRDQKEEHRVRVSLWAPDGELLATSRADGDPPPPEGAPPPRGGASPLRGGAPPLPGGPRGHPRGPRLRPPDRPGEGPPHRRARAALELADGRVLRVGPSRERDRPPAMAAIVFASLAAAVALGAYPVARRITRRLERLGATVEQLGEGDLSARVAVEGNDEVADVARSFNRAAGRIEALVEAQRGVLLSASHELRSPLARLRVAVELLAGDGPDLLREEAERDIEELDELIGDLLLTASLRAADRPTRSEPVDLRGLLAEEAERVGAAVEGEAVAIAGDPRMLRRLLRNLLENARRHGGHDAPIEARVVRRREGGVRISVEDRGPGVPESERERIFEPFHRPAGHSEGEHGGVGLGLALVREIARHHGGDARCLARAGGGSVFEVDLPGSPP